MRRSSLTTPPSGSLATGRGRRWHSTPLSANPTSSARSCGIPPTRAGASYSATVPGPATPSPFGDRYGPDVLAGRDPRDPRPWAARRRPASRPVPAEPGLVVEDVETGWVGAVVRVEKSGGMHVVVLEDRHGRTRTFGLGPGFWVDGEPVELVAPAAPAASAGPARPARTASGSVAVPGARARVARASRLWVEGRHDAELV